MNTAQRQIKLFLAAGGAYCLFWALLMLLSARSITERVLPYLLAEWWNILYFTAINFFIHLYAIPYVRVQRLRLLWVLLLTVACLILFSPGTYLWMLLGKALFWPASQAYTEGTWPNMLRFFSSATLAAGFLGAIKYFIDNNELQRHNQQLRIEKQASELEFLRAQTNPHFLFNTLNNIYGLARDQSALTAPSILRLSKILRFMLYETSGTHIPISHETAIIGDYLELEKLRYSSRLDVNYRYDTDDEQQPLPPLLLLPLIENAFKHGASETRQQPFVHIALTVRQAQLLLTIENSMPPEKTGEPAKKSIGLENIRRQLQLQFSDYEFETVTAATRFTTRLRINLNSYETRYLPDYRG